jgi:arylsulfatase A-like enzyme
MKNTLCLMMLLVTTGAAGAAQPNIVIIFADDLGYGDLGVYGNPTIRTPNLDRMAAEGQRWTDFYVASSVCTPSRAGLLTGRLPIRYGLTSEPTRVFFPDSPGGLPGREITIAEILKARGYATAAVGKWHLGHLPRFLPMEQGFDSYYGIPYSNDMDKVEDRPKDWTLWVDPDFRHFNVPLMRGTKIIERPVNQHTITRRYTEEAVRFIQRSKDGPFFLYLAHSLPHVPLFRSPEFAGVSRRGLYGDVIEEIDWSAGRVLDTLRAEGLAANTLVVFTSDNGPWLIFREQGGSAGPLREGKGSTWDGGMRVPALFWWPGTIEPGLIHDMGSTLDLLRTVAALAGGRIPDDRILDGYDISPALLGAGSSPRGEMIFYRGTKVFAARVGEYKAHFFTRTGYRDLKATPHDPPLLYHLGHDPGEKHDIAEENPDVVADIVARVERHRASVEPAANRLENRTPEVLTDPAPVGHGHADRR